MTFEITVGSADDVQRMARWAADEGWNPGNTDSYAFFATVSSTDQCNTACSLSAGVSKPKVFRGR